MLKAVSIISLILCFSSFANERPRIASDHWPNFTNTDGTGLYWEIIEHVYQQYELQVDTETTNYTRSMALVKNGKAHAYVGSYLDEVEFAQYPQYHLDVDYIAACTQKSSNTLIDKKHLLNQEVAWIKDYSFERVLDLPLDYQEVPDRETGLKMVANGRVDLYLDAKSDIDIFFREQPQFKTMLKCKVVHREKIYLAFSEDSIGQSLRSKWDETIPVLIRNGYLKEVFKRYSLKPFPYDSAVKNQPR